MFLVRFGLSLILCGVFKKAVWSNLFEARLFLLAQFPCVSWRFCLGILALFWGIYILFYVVTVLNAVCIHIDVRFLSLYAFGFYFWPIVFYKFCII